MDHKQLHQLEAMDRSAGRLKARVVAAAVMAAFCFWQKVGPTEWLMVPFFALVLVPIGAMAYRVASLAAGRKVY